MIFAAGIAAQAASALAQALQSKTKPAPGGGSAGSAGTDFQNLTADIDALLPGGQRAGATGPGSGTGSLTGDLASLGSDLLGSLGLGAAPPAPPPSASSATQAYASASTLGV